MDLGLSLRTPLQRVFLTVLVIVTCARASWRSASFRRRRVQHWRRRRLFSSVTSLRLARLKIIQGRTPLTSFFSPCDSE